MSMLLGASPGYAGEWQTVSAFEVWSGASGNLVRVTLPTRVNPDNCTDPDSYFFKGSMDAAHITRDYSLLMAVNIAGRDVDLYVSGCANDRPAIEVVRLGYAS